MRSRPNELTAWVKSWIETRPLITRDLKLLLGSWSAVPVWLASWRRPVLHGRQRREPPTPENTRRCLRRDDRLPGARDWRETHRPSASRSPPPESPEAFGRAVRHSSGGPAPERPA